MFLCYYLFGIPLAWYLGSDIGYSLGVFGLTIGIAIGTWVHAGLYMGIIYCTNWESEVEKAKARVGNYTAADVTAADVTAASFVQTDDDVSLKKNEWIRVRDDDDDEEGEGEGEEEGLYSSANDRVNNFDEKKLVEMTNVRLLKMPTV